MTSDEQIAMLREALRRFADNSSVQCNQPDECEYAEAALAATAQPDQHPSGDSQEQDGVRVRFQEAEGATEVGPFNLFTTPLDVLDGGWRSMEDHTPVEDEQYWVNFQWPDGDEGQGYAIWMGEDWLFDVDDCGDLVSRQRALEMAQEDGTDGPVARITHFHKMPAPPADRPAPP